MVLIRDLRDSEVAKKANAHTEILEDLVNQYQENTLSHVAKLSVGKMIKLSAAGIAAGYLAASNQAESLQYVEHSAALLLGVTSWLYAPLITFALMGESKAKNLIEKENEQAQQLHSAGRFNEYVPVEGLEFKNHVINLDTHLENSVQEQYWGNLETYHRPVSRGLINAMSCALSFTAAAVVLNALNYCTQGLGLDFIEAGFEMGHALFSPAMQEVTESSHQHPSRFEIYKTACIGGAYGLISTAIEYLKGSNQEINVSLMCEDS